MSSAFDWKKSLINSISESLPEIECLLIINSVGGVLEHKIAENHKNESDYRILEKMARKVSLRFKIVEFDDDFGGLSITINILKRNIMVVKSLTPEYYTRESINN
jgi:hypothetical protein